MPQAKRVRLVALAALLFIAVGCMRQGSESIAPERLVLAIQPTLAASEMLEKAKPLEQFLERQIFGVDVEVYIPLSQAGVIEAIRFGQADVAFMGAWPALLAVTKADADLVLAEVREVVHDDRKVEETYYFSYWIVPSGSPYTSLEQLRGEAACFPSPISGSGYVGPMGRLVELGLLSRQGQGEVDPKRFFSDVVFGGGYAQCWNALRSGQVDVTIIAGDVPETLYREVLANTRVLDQQGPLPSHGVVLSEKLQEPLRSRVVSAIEGLSAPEYRDLMRSFISGIFVGFERTNAQTHLGAFQSYLDKTGLAFTERLG